LRPDKVLSMLGIAAKAGGVASGEFSTEKAVKDGSAYLVIVAGDASENTQKMFRNMTDFYEVPMYVYADKETLGHFIGKEFRASLAITNEGLAHSIEEKLKTAITTE
jgi:ribosomal protein L7Ae-like RNA K-turn-binding protein